MCGVCVVCGVYVVCVWCVCGTGVYVVCVVCMWCVCVCGVCVWCVWCVCDMLVLELTVFGLYPAKDNGYHNNGDNQDAQKCNTKSKDTACEEKNAIIHVLLHRGPPS